MLVVEYWGMLFSWVCLNVMALMLYIGAPARDLYPDFWFYTEINSWCDRLHTPKWVRVVILVLFTLFFFPVAIFWLIVAVLNIIYSIIVILFLLPSLWKINKK